jgi:hypothetical protein
MCKGEADDVYQIAARIYLVKSFLKYVLPLSLQVAFPLLVSFNKKKNGLYPGIYICWVPSDIMIY